MESMKEDGGRVKMQVWASMEVAGKLRGMALERGWTLGETLDEILKALEWYRARAEHVEGAMVLTELGRREAGWKQG